MSVTLRQIQDEEGSQRLTASIAANGNLVFEGLDYGDGVEKLLGEREYEYILTVQAADTAALLEALGSKDDILSALQQEFAKPETIGPSNLLQEHNIPFEFWSRLGE